MKKVLPSIVLFVLAASQATLAQSACQKLDGEWAGTMAGRFAGPVTMSISNCKVVWKLPDGRTNYCDYSDNQGKMEYACSLGSRGTVVAQAKKIAMRNTYTGNDYVVNLTKK